MKRVDLIRFKTEENVEVVYDFIKIRKYKALLNESRTIEISFSIYNIGKIDNRKTIAFNDFLKMSLAEVNEIIKDALNKYLNDAAIYFLNELSSGHIYHS